MLEIFHREFLEENFAEGHRREKRRRAFLAGLSDSDLNNAIARLADQTWDMIDGVHDVRDHAVDHAPRGGR